MAETSQTTLWHCFTCQISVTNK